jgi:carbamoyl-phosphate synthase large subunit
MKTVLVTGAGGPAGMAVLQSLKVAPEKFKTVAVDSSPRAAGLLKATYSRVVLKCNEPGYIDQLRALCEEYHVDVIIPTVDEEIPYLVQSGVFSDGMARAILPDERAVKMAQDKLSYQFLEVDTPTTVPFPAIIKMRRGRGSKGIRFLDKEPIDMIVQERIPGDVYLAQALCKDGEVLRWCITKRLDPAVGPATSAVSAYDLNIADRLQKVVKTLRWNGAIGIEFILSKTNGSYYLIDINARICGQSHLCTMAGMNLAYGLVQLSLGQEVTISKEYKTDVTFVRAWEDTTIG